MRRFGAISEVLDQAAGSFQGEPTDWSDVLDRAGAEESRRHLVRVAILAATVLVVALALAAPFGLAGRVIGLFRDEGRPVALTELTQTERGEFVMLFCRRIALVTPPGKAPETRCLDRPPKIEEIANNGTRLYWRLTYPGGGTCVASGRVRPYRLNGGRRSRLGSVGCGSSRLNPMVPTPKRPITVQAAIEVGLGDRRARLFGASGLAGEGVESVGLVEKDGDVLKTHVRGRTYDFRRPPNREWEAIAAFDDSGKEVYRESLHLGPLPRDAKQYSSRPKSVRPGPLARLPKRPPIQHGEASGAVIDVYRSGLVAVHLPSASAAYALVRPGRLYPRVVIGCQDVAYGAGRWETLGSGSASTFGTEMRAVVASFRGSGSPAPPFDVCSIRGTYGRRWNDARGTHDAVEVAFTPLGHRYFAEQAAARDLALFMRTPQIRAIRKTMIRGAAIPTAKEIARRFSSRVIGLRRRRETPAASSIGVWSNGRDQLLAIRRAEDGRRMFATLRAGRFGPHNLTSLGFLIY